MGDRAFRSLCSALVATFSLCVSSISSDTTLLGIPSNEWLLPFTSSNELRIVESEKVLDRNVVPVRIVWWVSRGVSLLIFSMLLFTV